MTKENNLDINCRQQVFRMLLLGHLLRFMIDVMSSAVASSPTATAAVELAAMKLKKAFA